jgi:predicted enzyme related to lactoylglutathione lyase
LDKREEDGRIGWVDLTVDDALGLRDFYSEVVGWGFTEVAMGGYSDFCMTTASGATVAGVCHSRGINADLPPQWLIYITVADVDAAARRCVELGGAVLAGPRGMGGAGRYCVIRDPAGAVAALFQNSARTASARLRA